MSDHTHSHRREVTTTPRLIYVSGCDDATSVVMDLTDAEYATVQKVAEAVSALGGGCKPTMATASDGEPHYGWPWDPEDES